MIKSRFEMFVAIWFEHDAIIQHIQDNSVSVHSWLVYDDAMIIQWHD